MAGLIVVVIIGLLSIIKIKWLVRLLNIIRIKKKK